MRSRYAGSPYESGPGRRGGRGGGKGGKDWPHGGKWSQRRALEHGEFDWGSAAAVERDPEVIVAATYSYVAKSPSTVDVVCPAWSVRELQQRPGGECIDLSLERGLRALQGSDGGFELTTDLAATLGLEAPASVLGLAEDPSARAFGALLALKTVAVYKGDWPPPGLQEICACAERLACGHLGLTASALRAALDAVGTAPRDSPTVLPAAVLEALCANFAPRGRWSFFELWAHLLPPGLARELAEDGGVLCPRFFLVDLACAPLSFYDIDKAFPLVRRGTRVFVGQPSMNDDGGNRDVTRQGRQLEASLVRFGWLEEDHVLTAVRLPGAPLAIFSAAPDAVVSPDGPQLEPLAEGDDLAYEEAGYFLDEVFELPPSVGHERCRLWRADTVPAPPEAYVEVKKTTHLHGMPGQFKMTKFWTQAALMRCGGVVVAKTEGSADGDSVHHVEQFSLAALEAGVDAPRIWGVLASMLRHVFQETSPADGSWTVRLQKARGPNVPVRLVVQQGWEDPSWDDGPLSAHERFAGLFETPPEYARAAS